MCFYSAQTRYSNEMRAHVTLRDAFELFFGAHRNLRWVLIFNFLELHGTVDLDLDLFLIHSNCTFPLDFCEIVFKTISNKPHHQHFHVVRVFSLPHRKQFNDRSTGILFELKRPRRFVRGEALTLAATVQLYYSRHSENCNFN